MNQLRVLHIVTSLEPGGMENGVCNLATRLAPAGIDSSVACLERSGPFAERLPNKDAAHVLGKKGGFSLKAVVALNRLIRRLRPNVLHAHNLGPLIYTALASWWGRSRPILQGEHSLLAPWELTPQRLRQRQRLYRACAAVHTVSEVQRVELLRLGFPEEKITSIPNGVDGDRFQPADRSAARRALGLDPDAAIAGIVARFGPHKGHGRLLAAFARVAAELPSAHLACVGTGGSEEKAVAAAVAEHPFRDRIHLLGYRADLENIYPALDLLVIPSTNEGMSNVALEAMSCGVPVLANQGVGNDAMITDGTDGWLAELSQEEPLARRLGTLLRAREDIGLAGKNARRTVESRFLLGQMLAAYESLYRRLAK